MSRNAICSLAGLSGAVRKTQKLTDGVQREAQFPAMADEIQSFEVFRAEAPLIAFGVRRIWHQTDLFIVTDRLHFAARPLRQLADGERVLAHGLPPLESTVVRGPMLDGTAPQMCPWNSLDDRYS